MAQRLPYPPCVSSGCKTRECCAKGYKSIWPDVVGMDRSEAKAIIEYDNPLVTVVFMRQNQGRLTDHCCNRVYIFVDDHYRVLSEPFVPMVG
ncbi:UNVERIFIED_CONTAM: hypothetical protein Sradi_3769400 [Sesamum radiatum]|uniref:Uncharacterized protein n=1 Tax=Sesamum radiatum TaxID=300843 RepID=A0AAW2PZ47_SESRA